MSSVELGCRFVGTPKPVNVFELSENDRDLVVGMAPAHMSVVEQQYEYSIRHDHHSNIVVMERIITPAVTANNKVCLARLLEIVSTWKIHDSDYLSSGFTRAR